MNRELLHITGAFRLEKPLRHGIILAEGSETVEILPHLFAYNDMVYRLHLSLLAKFANSGIFNKFLYDIDRG